MASKQQTAPAKSRGMNPKLWIPLGILIWLIFVISQIPAVWGAWFMTRSNDQLALSGVSGSLWNGRASLASVRVQEQDYSLGELRWELHPLSLITLNPCATIHTRQERQQIDGDVCSSLGGSIALREADLTAPAALFQGALPLPFDGQLSARIEDLEIQNQQLQALKGNLTWTSARIHNGSNWMDLGSFAAELSQVPDGVSANIFNIDGPVQLQLQAVLALAGGGNVKGQFSMSRDFAEEINAGAWISMFAQPEGTDDAGNNRYRVDLSL
jgi:Bacterial type II secretion system protein N.